MSAQEGDEAQESGNAVAAQLSEMMGMLNMSASNDSTQPVQRLASLDLDGVIKFIQEGNAKSIITMAGAGISTAAGIPDFRSPGSGLYDSLQEYDLPDPMAIFSLDYFKERPEPFFKVAKTFYPESYKPTLTHCLLKLLDDKGLLLRHFTQNIDMLEEKAGLDADKIVYAHGNFRTSHCISCGKEYSLEWMRECVMSDKVPTCDDKECKGTVKPDIVFFGEALPPRFATRMKEDFKEADLLIIIGTSLVVMPFASLVDMVKEDVPRMYINREMSEGGGENWLLMLMGIKQGLLCGQDGNYRDVFAKGDCDDVVMEMATKLGWKDDLTKLHRSISVAAEKKPQGAQASASSKPSVNKAASPKKSPPKTSPASAKKSPPKTSQAPSKKSPPKK